MEHRQTLRRRSNVEPPLMHAGPVLTFEPLVFISQKCSITSRHPGVKRETRSLHQVAPPGCSTSSKLANVSAGRRSVRCRSDVLLQNCQKKKKREGKGAFPSFSLRLGPIRGNASLPGSQLHSNKWDAAAENILHLKHQMKSVDRRKEKRLLSSHVFTPSCLPSSLFLIVRLGNLTFRNKNTHFSNCSQKC